MRILVINSGSSSIKYKLFNMPQEAVLSKGGIEHIGEKGSSVKDHYL
jgi:acetate kinase